MLHFSANSSPIQEANSRLEVHLNSVNAWQSRRTYSTSKDGRYIPYQTSGPTREPPRPRLSEDQRMAIRTLRYTAKWKCKEISEKLDYPLDQVIEACAGHPFGSLDTRPQNAPLTPPRRTPHGNSPRTPGLKASRSYTWIKLHVYRFLDKYPNVSWEKLRLFTGALWYTDTEAIARSLERSSRKPTALYREIGLTQQLRDVRLRYARMALEQRPHPDDWGQDAMRNVLFSGFVFAHANPQDKSWITPYDCEESEWQLLAREGHG
ncbi:uncharacterized protein F4817DRAFT_344242 [Daldinia loculata]|uniref:uncharacterized protein n=1 Tax=Daldinia loculata TaxID=103429 RepID=UPI0020C49B3B|nr:uncharacterized protein F4817DRAFT_344242 [Daldinia loculata]KAI1645281.1 hypothetical protein F4817DRAFT_344242 [Daldinia loculata]